MLSACSYVPGLKPAPTPVSRQFLDPAPLPRSQPSSYDSEAKSYFFKIAFGSEYGSGPPGVYKWTNDVKIKVHGNPTSADIDTLEQVVSELNDLQSEITLNIVKRNANVEIYFAPESRFRSIEPYYVPVNMGFFSVAGSDTGAIDNARILIASTGITQNERSHLIREELTQSLGLMRDSNRYPESIFYQGWTSTTEYATHRSRYYQHALRLTIIPWHEQKPSTKRYLQKVCKQSGGVPSL